MKVIGLAGWSGAGKTTLLARVIPYLLGQGLRVSVIKHAHHEFDVDVPGKDSWVHRQSGATEVLVSSARRWALMHELRGAGEPRLPELLAKMSPVDLVVVEGFKREPHRKIEVHRLANGKPLLFPDDPGIVGIATDAEVETTLPAAHLDDIEAVAALLLRSAAIRSKTCWRSVRPKAERQMAQLSDDCFAFGGPMMSVDEAVGIIAARVTAVQEIETVALAEADGRILARRYRRAAAAAAVHQFRRRWLCGGQRRSAARCRSEAFAVTGRIQAGASAAEADQAGRGGADLHRRADAGRRRHRVHAGGRADRRRTARWCCPAGLRPGANVRPAGEDIPAGHAALAAGRRLRPQDVALAAASA